MEPVTVVIDKVKGFAKSTQDFFTNHHLVSSRRHQIEILKRLLREAFSDLMKLRDRQDKVERILSFYKSSRGSPFQEASTHVRGVVDVLGALLMMDDVDQHKYDVLNRAGIRTGVNSRFTFQTGIREKDSLVAEFVAGQRGQDFYGDDFGTSLSLAKVLYVANVSDWFSALAIPVGAQCRDVGNATSYSHQEKGLTDFLSFGPPLLNQHTGSGLGLTVSKLNIIASLAQFVSWLDVPGSIGTRHKFSTLGQVACQLSGGLKLSLFGVHQVSKSTSQMVHLGALSLPIGVLRRKRTAEASTDASAAHVTLDIEDNYSVGSIAVAVESRLDECTRIGAWVEMESTNPRSLQWAITMSDTPEGELGWGLSLGGMNHGPRSWDHFQVEAFLKLRSGKKFSLQPGLVCVMDGSTPIPALMFRSTWSL